jgi:ADP-ribose pyrophosphatase YjhB (NUDIX family)
MCTEGDRAESSAPKNLGRQPSGSRLCPSEEQHSVAVAAVVLDESDRVLLMQRREHGHWEPPGGVLRVGESVEEGLRREVAEETRVVVDVGPLGGIYENPDHGVLSLVFRCTPKAGSPQQRRRRATCGGRPWRRRATCSTEIMPNGWTTPSMTIPRQFAYKGHYQGRIEQSSL